MRMSFLLCRFQSRMGVIPEHVQRGVFPANIIRVILPAVPCTAAVVGGKTLSRRVHAPVSSFPAFFHVARPIPISFNQPRAIFG